MASPTRIYLDNAATSWPKPPEVYDAVDRYQRHCGAPFGRSAYAEAAEVAAHVESARRQLRRLMECNADDAVVLCGNGTDALNLAIHGLMRPGDHAVTTDADHNSVLRPLSELCAHGCTVDHACCDKWGHVDPERAGALLRPGTRLVAITHASNVTGIVQPVAEIARLAHQVGALVLLDAAQTLGHWPCNMAELGVDLIAAPGHKGLLGPLGTGVLIARREVATQLQSLRQGGTGSHSQSDRQPDEIPDRFEAGNLNVPGIVGLDAGLKYIIQRGVNAIVDHERQLTLKLFTRLHKIPGVTVHGPGALQPRVGVVSISVAGYDPREFAAALDATFRVQVRAGLHCAPRIHAALGTLGPGGTGGTVRFSVGPFTTAADIDEAARAVEALARGT